MWNRTEYGIGAHIGQGSFSYFMDSREGREGFESNACNREANFYESILPLNKSSGIQTREKKIQQPDISEQYPGWVGVKRKSNVRHRIKAAVTKNRLIDKWKFYDRTFSFSQAEKSYGGGHYEKKLESLSLWKRAQCGWGQKPSLRSPKLFHHCFLH